MKSIKMFGKSVPLLAIVMISVLAIGASAALLTFYGKVVTDVTVDQSVLLDGQNYQTPIEVFLPDVYGGTCICYMHDLENFGEVQASIDVEYFVGGVLNNPAVTGIDMMLLGLVDETHGLIGDKVNPNELTFKNLDRPEVPCPVATVRKTWECCTTTFLIELAEITEGEETYDHTEFSLVISSGENGPPVFQVGTGQMFGGGSPPMYQEYGEDLGGLFGGWETSSPTMTIPDGIVIIHPDTGAASVNGDSKFLVEIPCSYLGGCGATYYWAASVFGNWYSDTTGWHYYGYSQYPANWDRWTGDGVFVENHAGIFLDTPMMLAPGELLDFGICYDFDIALIPATYEIITVFSP